MSTVESLKNELYKNAIEKWNPTTDFFAIHNNIFTLDLDALNPRNWTDTWLINSYISLFNLLYSNKIDKDTYANFNLSYGLTCSYILSLIGNPESVLATQKKLLKMYTNLQLYKYDRFIFPYYAGECHFLTFEVKVKEKRINIYDSLSPPSTAVIKCIVECLHSWLKTDYSKYTDDDGDNPITLEKLDEDKKNKHNGFKMKYEDKYQVFKATNAPNQVNFNDCGLYCIKSTISLATNSPLDYFLFYDEKEEKYRNPKKLNSLPKNATEAEKKEATKETKATEDKTTQFRLTLQLMYYILKKFPRQDTISKLELRLFIKNNIDDLDFNPENKEKLYIAKITPEERKEIKQNVLDFIDGTEFKLKVKRDIEFDEIKDEDFKKAPFIQLCQQIVVDKNLIEVSDDDDDSTKTSTTTTENPIILDGRFTYTDEFNFNKYNIVMIPGTGKSKKYRR